VLTVFTAGTAGSYVQQLIARSAGNCTASVLRVFVNNGGTNSTVANNILINELGLPTTSVIQTQALQTASLGLNFALPALYKINVALGTSVSAGWCVSVVGGDY
jgi:hypothetical protein